MTDKQPEALRLADELEDSLESHDGSSLTARCQGIANDAAAFAAQWGSQSVSDGSGCGTGET